MSNYIFLIDKNRESETVYFAIDAEKIEILNESDTYDNYGQSVSPEDAGNSIGLLSQKAVDIANKAYHDNHAEYDDTEVLQHFSIGDFLSAYEHKEYSDVLSDKDLKIGEDYSEYFPTCKGFNYWDGSNWKTIVVEREHGETDFEILDNEELTEELNQAIQNKEFVEDGFGRKIYETEQYEIEYNYCQGTWASYYVTEK